MHALNRVGLMLVALAVAAAVAPAEAASYQVLKGFSRMRTPYAPLVLGTDGAFYGTTYQDGTAFRITADGSSFSVLHIFYWRTEGAELRGGLAEGADGAFYGTASKGGAFDHGAVFRITADGSSFSVLHSFGTDGETPRAGLVRGTDGAFYGTTFQGGASYYGEQ